MSDLIPTTADIRDAYSAESYDSKYANRMFDLWLAKYKAKIQAKTEERIIEFLENYLLAFQAPEEALMQRRMADFIELIKGEQK